MSPTAKQSLQALFSSLPTTDSADPAQTAQAFMLAIQGIPDEFVAEAATRFIQGRVLRKSHAFLPAPPEFAIEARKCWDEARAAAYKPAPLPPPTPSKNEGLTPEEVARREAIVEAMNAKLEPKLDEPPRRHALTLEDELAMIRDRPLTASPHFTAFLQRQMAEEEASIQHRQYVASTQRDDGRAA